MARIQQDQFIDEDEEEEVCPLCVEEFDLGDKYFRPCPCGYQICQFCYNNIKTTMNGLCPACRRPYDDKPFQFKNVTPEELLQHSQLKAAQQKKKAAAKQKEVQKREADNLSRKHLAGLRVRQKNLVYVTGMKPKIQGDRVAELLRGKEYFGQYGDIIKVVVSKSKDAAYTLNQPVGIYVTFTRKDDAAACIEAINQAAQSGDGKIRAQHGTTKYCSAYLRGDTCNNKSCMFLHEPGEQNESFTRQDLSSMNAAGTQQSIDDQGDMDSLQPQPPPQHTQPVAAAMQPELAPSSPASSSADGSGLPAAANWANNAARRLSRATTTSNASPVVANSLPARSSVEGYQADPESSARSGKDSNSESTRPRSSHTKPHRQPKDVAFQNLLKAAFDSDIDFNFSPNGVSEEDLKAINLYPPLWDPKGGLKRRQMKERKAKELREQQEAAEAALRAPPKPDVEEQPEHHEHTEQQGGAGGSLQLGGEPEERQERNFGLGPHSAIQPPSQAFGLHPGFNNYMLGDDISTASGSTGRGPTPSQAQQQQLLLQQFEKARVHPQVGGAHGRHNSRFAFTDNGNLKPGTILKQQGVVLGQNTSAYGGQSSVGGSHVFSSGVQGPPPGLKPTGTPPVSGGGMFGQGYGFTAGYGANTTGSQADKSWDLHRGQRVNQDTGKRELMFSSHANYPSASTQASALGHLSYPYGSQPGASAFQEPSGQQKQKKKGKKHRHANTSSSGGGGLADTVADPSSLQARLHQTGGAGMNGQGLYGGQGQDDLPALGQTLDVSRRSTPSVPPGLFLPGTSFLERNEQNEMEKPIQAPPGLEAKPVEPETPESKATSKLEKTGKSAHVNNEIVVPTLSKKAATPVSKKTGKAQEKQAITPKPAILPSSSQQGSIKIAQEPAQPVVPKTVSPRKPVVTTSEKQRPHLGKLKIETAPLPERKVESPSVVPSVSSAKLDLSRRPSRAGSITASSISSRPDTPAAATISTGSPMRRATQPRTLRITDTPRAETPPALPTPTPSIPLIAAATAGASKQASRRPSITSTMPPGTPISERVDAFSVTSASVSRASSPPPSVASRQVRKETTSKKRRKEKELKDAEIAAIITPKDTVEEVAPILARKTKKNKSKPAGSGPTPAPKTEAPAATAPAKKSEKPAALVKENSPPQIESNGPQEPKTPGKGKVKPPSPPAPSLPTTPIKDSPRVRESTPSAKSSPHQLTAGAILQALESTHQLALSTLSLLKPLSQKSELKKLGIDPFSAQDLQNHIEQLRYELSRADEELLIQGKAVRKDLGNEHPARISGRTMITPLGVRVTCLTKEEEDKFLDLEAKIWETKGQRRWGGGKPTTAEGSQSVSGLVQRAKPESSEDSAQKLFEGAPSEDLPYLPGQNRRAPFNDWKSPAAAFNNSFVPPLAYDSTKITSAPLPTPPPPELAGLMEVQTTSTGSVIARAVPRDGVPWKEQLKVTMPAKDREGNAGQTWREPPMGVAEAVKVAREMGREAPRTMGINMTDSISGYPDAESESQQPAHPSMTSKVEAKELFNTQHSMDFNIDITAAGDIMAGARIILPGEAGQKMLKEWEKEVSAGHQHMRTRMNAVGIDGSGAHKKLGESRRETEINEKKLNALIKKNRKAVFGGSGY
ncbi:hypothetical protein EG328_007682 [Venturia inaequalis]|uniref:CCR4-NOT core complex subunit Not4 n=1 Tax=Venturia inaequalis TaxID=5025 RepID=A0A8H3YQF7_VENIN|nr:hypothetical protein EG328_007682 [Venturia inaequalis]